MSPEEVWQFIPAMKKIVFQTNKVDDNKPKVQEDTKAQEKQPFDWANFKLPEYKLSSWKDLQNKILDFD